MSHLVVRATNASTSDEQKTFTLFARSVVNWLGLKGARLSEAIEDHRYTNCIHVRVPEEDLRLDLIFTGGNSSWRGDVLSNLGSKIEISSYPEDIKKLKDLAGSKVNWSSNGYQGSIDGNQIPAFKSLYEKHIKAVHQREMDYRQEADEKAKNFMPFAEKVKQLLESFGAEDVSISSPNYAGSILYIEIKTPYYHPHLYDNVSLRFEENKVKGSGTIILQTNEETIQAAEQKISELFPSAEFKVERINRYSVAIHFRGGE
jgi:hypothetical protein